MLMPNSGGGRKANALSAEGVNANPVVRSTSGKSVSVSGPRKKLAPTMKANAEPPNQRTRGSRNETASWNNRCSTPTPANVA